MQDSLELGFLGVNHSVGLPYLNQRPRIGMLHSPALGPPTPGPRHQHLLQAQALTLRRHIFARQTCTRHGGRPSFKAFWMRVAHACSATLVLGHAAWSKRTKEGSGFWPATPMTVTSNPLIRRCHARGALTTHEPYGEEGGRPRPRCRTELWVVGRTTLTSRDVLMTGSSRGLGCFRKPPVSLDIFQFSEFPTRPRFPQPRQTSEGQQVLARCFVVVDHHVQDQPGHFQ